MLPSDVNNAIRELMKQLKDFQVGAQGDPVTVGGNLVVSGTSNLVGTATLGVVSGATISGSSNTITNVSLTTGVTGTLPVGNGGTGATSFTSGAVLKGSGTSAITTATAGTDYVKPDTASTFTAAQTFRAANAIRSEAASTQDAIVLAGRAGGTSSYAVTLTPATLSSSTTLTLPNVTDTFATIGTAQTFTAAQTFRAASAIRSEADSTQDAIVIAGRAGGTSSYAITMTPATLSASRTVTFPDGGGNYTVGYRNAPAVGTQTGSYTLAVGDVGKYVQVGSGGSITIPDATFAEGDVVSVFNNTTGNITITCSISTAYIAGTDSDKASVTLATRGVATILFISSTVCVITGNVT